MAGRRTITVTDVIPFVRPMSLPTEQYVEPPMETNVALPFNPFYVNCCAPGPTHVMAGVDPKDTEVQATVTRELHGKLNSNDCPQVGVISRAQGCSRNSSDSERTGTVKAGTSPTPIAATLTITEIVLRLFHEGGELDWLEVATNPGSAR